MRAMRLGDVYRWIEPGPVVLLTTARRGRANVMAMSWLMMMEFEPPLLACLVSGNNFSFAALKATREAVIAVPSVRLARKLVAVGNCSGREVDKFAAIGLTPLPASRVAAPLVAECLANFECRVVDTRFVNKYNMFVLEVVAAWQDTSQKNRRTIHHQGRGRFVVDGRILTLPSAKA